MVLCWYDYSGKRNRKSVSTGLKVKSNKKRAEDMLRDAFTQQRRIIENSPVGDTLLFSDLLEQWLEAVRKDLKPTTFGGYQMSVQRIIAPYFREKGILLRDLTADNVNAFYDFQLSRVKAKTVIEYHNRISSALKYALKNELIDQFPVDKLKRPKAERFVGKHLSESEVIALFDTLQSHKLEIPVILGAFYGLRREEILGLRWESVNFENDTIIINHTVTETVIDGKRTITAADTTKTKSSHRTLPMIPIIKEKLLVHRTEQERNRKLCGRSYNKDESRCVCTDELGSRLIPNYLTYAFPSFMNAQ